MKTFLYRNRFLWASLLSFAVGLLIVTVLTSCETIPKETGCVRASRIMARVMRAKGKEVRVCDGYFRGQPHRWVEVKNGDRWEIYDDAIWYVNNGWTGKEHGDYEYHKIKY